MYRSKRVAIYVEQCNAGIITCDDEGNVYRYNELLRTKPDKDGYLNVCIKSVYIPNHQIIAYIKYGEAAIQQGIVARHLNDVCTDNRWENIEIGTPLDNSRDIPAGKLSAAAKKVWAARTPEQKSAHLRKVAANTSKVKLSAKGRKAALSMSPELRKQIAKKIAIKRGFRTLTDTQKLEVRELYLTGLHTQYELSIKFNVSQQCICTCVKGLTRPGRNPYKSYPRGKPVVK